MEKLGIELDWVLVLTIENNGFIGISIVAEYCVPYKDSKLKSGWHKDDIDNLNRRIDDWTNVIMFKLLDKLYIDGIKDSILNKYKESEGITDTYAYNLSFNEMVIKQCRELNNEDNYYSWKDIFTEISLPIGSKNTSNYNIINKEI